MCVDTESALDVAFLLREKFLATLYMASPCKSVGAETTATKSSSVLVISKKSERRIGVLSVSLTVWMLHEDGGRRNIVVVFDLSLLGSQPFLKSDELSRRCG